MLKRVKLVNSLAIIAVVFMAFVSLLVGFLMGFQLESQRLKAYYVNSHLVTIANEEIKQTQIAKETLLYLQGEMCGKQNK